MNNTDTANSVDAPSPLVGPSAFQRFALAALMFLTTGVFGFIQTFSPLYLTASGLSKFQFGLVQAIGVGSALLVQPLLGNLSDRLDRRRPLIIAAAIWAGCSYLAFRFAQGFWGFALLTCAAMNGFQYLSVAGGVITGRLAQITGQRGGMAYIQYRVWGSVGYIVIAMTTGALVNRTLPNAGTATRLDLDPVFTYGPLLFFVVALVALFIPDPRHTEPPPAAVVPEIPAPDASKPDAPAHNPANNLNWFLAAFFLYIFGLYGASSFLPLYMKQLGATPFQITGMFAAGVICEVLVMSQVGRWTDTYGRRPALALSFLLMPLRLLLYAPATGPLWVMAVQMLHGINFGIVGTIAVVFINDLASPSERGALQARLAATQGIGNALGPIACGWLADAFGLRWMFAAMSLFGFAAFFVFLLRVRESNPHAVAHTHPLFRLIGDASDR